jgi:hypothetical protein
MTVIYILLFVTAAGFAVILIATILVIIGVRQEERYKTLAHCAPPSAAAMMARFVLGTYIRLLPEQFPGIGDEEEPPWYERPVGPRSH